MENLSVGPVLKNSPGDEHRQAFFGGIMAKGLHTFVSMMCMMIIRSESACNPRRTPTVSRVSFLPLTPVLLGPCHPLTSNPSQGGLVFKAHRLCVSLNSRLDPAGGVGRVREDQRRSGARALRSRARQPAHARLLPGNPPTHAKEGHAGSKEEKAAQGGTKQGKAGQSGTRRDRAGQARQHKAAKGGARWGEHGGTRRIKGEQGGKRRGKPGQAGKGQYKAVQGGQYKVGHGEKRRETAGQGCQENVEPTEFSDFVTK